VRSIATQLPKLEKIYCFDLFEEAATRFADWARSELGLDASADMDLRSALRDADVVTVAASRIKPLVVEESWFANGATILISGPISADEDFWTRQASRL
jgi:ornithine cyclodeaminase